MMIYLQLAAGLALLIVGGDLLVRGAVDLARHLGVSPLLIGLTLVGFGTSTPELVASIQAALAGSPGIAVGNVVGSNICNILLILGLAAVFHPLATPRAAFMRDGGMMLVAAIICTALVLMGRLDRPVGVGLLAILVAYVFYCYRRERLTAGSPQTAEAADRHWFVAFLAFAGGMALIIYGAGLLVFSAIDLARAAGISETVLGLTVVAIGTSLPELVASVMAGIRRQPAVAFGNVLGSNIYNVLGILGATALVQPIDVPAEIAALDIWVMLGATVILILFAVSKWFLNRWEGALFLAAYAVYLGYLAKIA
jgi:cation:H+ antiporter